MKRTYKLENLECANCAAKMESDIAKLDGVEDASIAFMTGKMRIEIADDADADAVMGAAQDIVSKYEGDCRIVR